MAFAGEQNNILSSFQSEIYPFRIEYPEGWEILRGDTSVSFISPLSGNNDTFSEAVLIQGKITNLSVKEEFMILKKYYSKIFDSFHELGSFYSGSNSAFMVYAFVHPTVGVMIGIDIGLMDKNHIYFVKYLDQKKNFLVFIPLLADMLKSFEVVRPNSNSPSRFLNTFFEDIYHGKEEEMGGVTMVLYNVSSDDDKIALFLTSGNLTNTLLLDTTNEGLKYPAQNTTEVFLKYPGTSVNIGEKFKACAIVLNESHSVCSDIWNAPASEEFVDLILP